MIELYPTEFECVDNALDVVYFKIKMFDESSAEIKSECLIGHITELDEYLANIRKAYLTMFPQWEIEK